MSSTNFGSVLIFSSWLLVQHLLVIIYYVGKLFVMGGVLFFYNFLLLLFCTWKPLLFLRFSFSTCCAVHLVQGVPSGRLVVLGGNEVAASVSVFRLFDQSIVFFLPVTQRFTLDSFFVPNVVTWDGEFTSKGTLKRIQFKRDKTRKKKKYPKIFKHVLNS